MQKGSAQQAADEDIEAVLSRFQVWKGSKGTLREAPSPEGVREISYNEALESSRTRWRRRDSPLSATASGNGATGRAQGETQRNASPTGQTAAETTASPSMQETVPTTAQLPILPPTQTAIPTTMATPVDAGVEPGVPLPTLAISAAGTTQADSRQVLPRQIGPREDTRQLAKTDLAKPNLAKAVQPVVSAAAMVRTQTRPPEHSLAITQPEAAQRPSRVSVPGAAGFVDRTSLRQEFHAVLAQTALVPSSPYIRSRREVERQVSMSMRVAVSEQVLICRRAADAGVSVSAYLRRCALEVETLRAQSAQVPPVIDSRLRRKVEPQVSMSMRVAVSEQVLICRRAAEAGVSASAYLRQCALDVETLRAQVQQLMENRTIEHFKGPRGVSPAENEGWFSRWQRRLWGPPSRQYSLKA